MSIHDKLVARVSAWADRSAPTDTLDELRLALAAERRAHAETRDIAKAATGANALLRLRVSNLQRELSAAEERAIIAEAQRVPLAEGLVELLDRRRSEFASAETQARDWELRARAAEAL